MNHALGSNRAEYGRRQDLQIQIRMAEHNLGRDLTDTSRMRLPELKQLWHETYQAGQAAGIFKTKGE